MRQSVSTSSRTLASRRMQFTAHDSCAAGQLHDRIGAQTCSGATPKAGGQAAAPCLVRLRDHDFGLAQGSSSHERRHRHALLAAARRRRFLSSLLRRRSRRSAIAVVAALRVRHHAVYRRASC